MISIIAVLVLVLVSTDAFWCGHALGRAGVTLRRSAGLYIGSWPLIIAFAVALAGYVVGSFLLEEWLMLLRCAALAGAACLVWHKTRGQRYGGEDPLRCGCNGGMEESALAGMTQVTDGALAAFALGCAGVASWLVAVLLAAAYGLLLLLGNYAGLRCRISPTGWYGWLPAVALLALAVLQWVI